MRILQSGRKKWLTIKTKITKTEKIKGNQAAVKDKAAADRADNPVHKVDRVVLVPEEEAVPGVPVLEVAALVVQAEDKVVPAVAGITDKLFFNVTKTDSRRIAFVLLED